ncbi:ABC transporter ATP-binding protein [Janthinobacterium sp. UMAB-60]|uniref:ABC transporter ATP-binding protein n=1 Tax=Janthinobacterium sp. UMAB-60 TaxID=1365365 RepID=UPI001C580A70|nr:ABC transporter ATP-binding protein [Janthinobacterium sp. UMAB-60]
MSVLLALHDVERSFLMGDEPITALDKINLTVETNDYLALTGTSGSGKSTLMNILGCLDRPTTGRYLFRGADVAAMNDEQLAALRSREIGFIFQNFNLLTRATALQNVMQPLIYQGVRRSERERMARTALAKVRLEHRMQHLPNQLSGGQRQRVAIARALCSAPSLLLADEPTGNLDSVTTAEIMALFDELHTEGHTLIVVTHDHNIAARCRRHVRLLDGRIADALTPMEDVGA